MNDFESALEKTQEYGIIQEIKLQLVTVSGLPHAKPNELVVFYNNTLGQVFSIQEDTVKILLLSQTSLKVGERVARTNEFLSIPVDESLLGSVIDPLGHSIFSSHTRIPQSSEEIEKEVLGMTKRKKIKKTFHTGVTLVDLMIPLAKGQRELIIGDRKTGKSSFLLTVAQRQVQEGSVVIYAAIGRKKNEIKKLYELFQKQNVMSQVVIVASDHQSPASIVYLTPYTAMSVAEYFRSQGRDSVVILDDLSTHAKYYRELSLLAGNFPGRDSYPGDIFYKHAHLLERAGNFIGDNDTEVSITCLPVAETVEGDMTGYITTNLMGMTDGHIYFDSGIFSLGMRPAINIPLSVTRVGNQVQTTLKKELHNEIRTLLTKYERLLMYSHFGAELSSAIQKTLINGEKIYTVFNQHYETPIPEAVQLYLMGLWWSGAFEKNTKDEIIALKDAVTAKYETATGKKHLDALLTISSLTDLGKTVKQIQEALT
ncbi:hypothetical protein HGA88_00435 [Candidatus Roizmanbacteria bacterium]|nr:hypothetical protein [Candidatus Roizmanbacteria bacterium]